MRNAGSHEVAKKQSSRWWEGWGETEWTKEVEAVRSGGGLRSQTVVREGCWDEWRLSWDLSKWRKKSCGCEGTHGCEHGLLWKETVTQMPLAHVSLNCALKSLTIRRSPSERHGRDNATSLRLIHYLSSWKVSHSGTHRNMAPVIFIGIFIRKAKEDSSVAPHICHSNTQETEEQESEF